MRKISKRLRDKLAIVLVILMMHVRSKELELFLLKVCSSVFSIPIPKLKQNINIHLIIGAVAVEPIDWSKGTAAMKIFEGLANDMQANADNTSPVDFLLVIGDGRDDEVIFRWANELGRERKIESVTTVSLGSRNTEAGFTLTQGVTGMFFFFLFFSGGKGWE